MQKEAFLKKSGIFLGMLYDDFASTPTLPLHSFAKEKTAAVAVDMVNGFVKEGNLSSARILQINDNVAAFCAACIKRALHVLAFADSHATQCPEFSDYPVHCLHNTLESELTQELKSIPGIRRIDKNSTNGYLEPEFQRFLLENPHLDTFIVTGCCTDLCIQQFCLTLKAAFNRENRRCRVVVPIQLTATFDLPVHNGDFSAVCAYFNMRQNGIEIINNITL